MLDAALLKSTELRELLGEVGMPDDVHFVEGQWYVHEVTVTGSTIVTRSICPALAIIAALIFDHLFDWLIEQGWLPELNYRKTHSTSGTFAIRTWNPNTGEQMKAVGSTKLEATFKACQAVLKGGSHD